MTEAAFYGDWLQMLKRTRSRMLQLIDSYHDSAAGDMKPIIYRTARIKSPASMQAKLAGRGLAPTAENAIRCVHDALGIRIVCAFVSDVYRVAEWLAAQPGLSVVQVKDYIANPKPNGYRSYHMILSCPEAGSLTFEVQLRTIATDCWATLEHQLKYKHVIAENEALIRAELKRCADEIAGTDLSMQTIRDIIRNES